MTGLDLDAWLADPALRVSHRRHTAAPAERAWQAARDLRLCDTRLLGRLVRWRIPGIPGDASFEELFTAPPFIVLDAGELSLISGLVGRIWTLRRDYPQLRDPSEFATWSRAGTVRVLFANWAAPDDTGSVLCSETRVESFGVQGRVGLASVRPLVRAFQHLVATDAMAAALRHVDRL